MFSGSQRTFPAQVTLPYDAATDTGGASHGQVTWGANVLWDPEFIHVHYKLQLKDVDPTGIIRYEILGNQEQACQACVDDSTCTLENPTVFFDVDFRLCGGGVCDGNFVTVKQSGKGRTDGVLRFPVHDSGLITKVWVRVDVKIDGDMKVLRSTAVTMVLPVHTGGQ